MSRYSWYTVHPSIKKLWHPSRFRVTRNPWDRRKVAELPPEYQKFYVEWIDSEEKETPVHWKPRDLKWVRYESSGEVKRKQDIPIPVNYPLEMNEGIWGGEGVIQGTYKKGKWRSPVPRYWSPLLQRSIVYSEVLDVYLSVVVTERALRLIDQHHGLDNYLMMTPAYDLKSLLALKLKKKIMKALMNRDFCHNDPERQQQLLDKYKDYMLPPNELEWYALSVDEALAKAKQIKESSRNAIPLKAQFRAQLFEQLKYERDNPPEEPVQEEEEKSSWMSKLNPFAKKSTSS